MPQSGDLSLYIHVPFCRRKCGYCHFYTIADSLEHRKKFLSALQKEISLRADLLSNRSLCTLYFGGGTPALLAVDEIKTILSALPPLTSSMEVTIEANPESIEESILQGFASLGINRISIGVQSFDDQLLTLLTRPHNASKAEKAVLESAKAGISNISIDLMYDLPHQSLSQFEESLKRAVDLPITHLSLYNLTFEPKTAFFRKKNSFLPFLPSEETSLRFLETATKILSGSGFIRYEISAWSKAKHPSQHNLGYWTGREYLGLGPSAHSYVNGVRWANHSDLQAYHKALFSETLPIDMTDTLSSKARIKELLALRLRVLSPFSLKDFEIDSETRNTMDQLKELGLISQMNDTVALTERGTLFYDTVAEMLIEANE